MATTKDLGLVKGATGPQGPTGPTGARGTTGPQGPAGKDTTISLSTQTVAVSGMNISSVVCYKKAGWCHFSINGNISYQWGANANGNLGTGFPKPAYECNLAYSTTGNTLYPLRIYMTTSGTLSINVGSQTVPSGTRLAISASYPLA